MAVSHLQQMHNQTLVVAGGTKLEVVFWQVIVVWTLSEWSSPNCKQWVVLVLLTHHFAWPLRTHPGPNGGLLVFLFLLWIVLCCEQCQRMIASLQPVRRGLRCELDAKMVDGWRPYLLLPLATPLPHNRAEMTAVLYVLKRIPKWIQLQLGV